MAETEGLIKNGFARLLAKPYFRRLVVGQVISSFGDWAATFALIALVFERTNSAAAVGAILVLRLLPPVLAAPIGGVLADRYSRRKLMIIASLSQGIVIALVPYLPILLIYLLALIHEGLGLIFISARDASVPDLVGDDLLEKANGLVLGSSYAAIPLGGVLFSSLQLLARNSLQSLPLFRSLFHDPLAAVFFFDALTFFFAVAMISRIRIKSQRHDSNLRLGLGLKEGFSYLWHNKKLRALSDGIMVATLGGGILFAIGISYVHQTLGATDTSFGWLATIWGLGMVLGLGISQNLQRLLKREKEHIFVASLLTISLSLIVMALFRFLWLAYLLAIPFGAGAALAVVLALTMAQQVTPGRMRGRIMSAFQMMVRLGLSVGALVIGTIAGIVPTIHVGITLDGNQIGLLLGSGLIAAGALASHRGFWSE